MDSNLQENLFLNDTASPRIIFEFTISTFLSHPSNFSSSSSSLSLLLISLTICIMDPKFYSLIQFSCRDHNRLMMSKVPIFLRLHVCYQNWYLFSKCSQYHFRSIYWEDKCTSVIHRFYLSINKNKSFLICYWECLLGWSIFSQILTIMVQAAFGPFSNGPWTPTNRWRKKVSYRG